MVLTPSLRQRALTLTLGLSALLVGGWSRAQDCPAPFEPPTTQQLATVAQEAPANRGFLWTVERNGVTSHLYGTMHLGKLAWTVPGPHVARALRTSQLLAMELDLTDPNVLAQVPAATRQPGPNPLPKALQQRMRDAAAAECLDWNQVADQRPEFQLSAIAVAQARRDGLEAAYGSEAGLAAIAGYLGIATRGLEKPQAQVDAFVAPTRAEQIELITAGLDMPPATARRVMQQLTEAWTSSDLARLASYADWCECVGTAAERALMDRVLDQRNRSLAETIGVVHSRHGASFFAIGALHMTGPNGLPALLAAQGFTVTRVF